MASCVSELFVLRQTKFAVCSTKKKAFVFETFFFTRKKIHTFDTTPKQFVSLIPNFWCWPMWKVAMFMHHDVAVLEQGCDTTFLTSQFLFPNFI